MELEMPVFVIGLFVMIIFLLVLVGAIRLIENNVEDPRNWKVEGRAAADKSFRAQIEDLFPFEDNTLFVSCTVTNGRIEVGEIVFLERLPEISITIMTIEQFRKFLERACQGDKIAFRLEKSPATATLTRGDYLITSVGGEVASDEPIMLEQAKTVLLE